MKQKTHDIQGDGGYQYALPDDWVEGYSSVVGVECPIGKQLEPGDYSVYKHPSGKVVLHFFALSPKPSEIIKLTYTTSESKES